MALGSEESPFQLQKKALLRCLIDKVVIHRVAPDQVRTRLLWKGGDTTTVDLPVPVGALADLSHAQELNDRVVALSQHGVDDETLAEQLTQEGFRSPLAPTLLVSTVKAIRLKHRIFRTRRQSHPRRVPGYLTIPQIAASLNISPHWIYHRINTGQITVTRDAETKLYLFPDAPDTLTQFQNLLSEKLEKLRF